ncbi:MAG: crossover junction endodeoxyribonuclease RuvC, partial [Planctomycetota bacterium]
MRVIGLDPGLRRTGWGVVDVAGSRLSHVANGVCASQGDDLAQRLLSLFNQIEEVVARWAPDQA